MDTDRGACYYHFEKGSSFELQFIEGGQYLSEKDWAVLEAGKMGGGVMMALPLRISTIDRASLDEYYKNA